MGWTTTQKQHNKTIKQHLDEIYGWEKTEVLDSALVNRSEYYAAVRFKATGEVWAGVAMVRFARNRYTVYNLAYKTMDETEGPGLYNCPERILDLLTATNKEWALKWRRSCRQKIVRRKSLHGLDTGTILRLSSPMYGTSDHEFKMYRWGHKNQRVEFEGIQSGRRYRIKNWRDTRWISAMAVRMDGTVREISLPGATA